MKAASRPRRKQSDLTDSDSQPVWTQERERQTSPVGKALSDAATQSTFPNLRFSGLGLDHFLSPTSFAGSDQDNSDLSDDPRQAGGPLDGHQQHVSKPSAPSTSKQSLKSCVSQPNLQTNRNLASSDAEPEHVSLEKRGYRRPRKAPAPLPPGRGSDKNFAQSVLNSDDNQSIEAVRNDLNHRRPGKLPSSESSPSSSGLDSDMDSDEEGQRRSANHERRSVRSIRKSLSQPDLDTIQGSARPKRASASTGANTPARIKSSVSTILKSARDATPKFPSNMLTKDQSGHQPSSKSLKNSSASIYSSKTNRSTHAVPQRATVRNARGEIEWKDAPPMPQIEVVHQTQNMSLKPPARLYSRSRSRGPEHEQRNPGYTSSDQDYYSPSSPPQHNVPFKALGAASKGRLAGRPELQRHASEDSVGYHTANDDDLEAREWERLRERETERDRYEVYQQQQRRDEEARIARRRAERERAIAEMREQERIAAQRKKAEAEARKLREKEEARLRKIQEQKDAEDRRIREQKRAEEQRIREAEEVIRKAEEKAAREEAERLAAIEAERLAIEAAIVAERLAREAAIQAAKDAIVEQARQLAEAKQQVIDEDKAARQAGRRDEKRAQRALNPSTTVEQATSDDEPVSDVDDLQVFDKDDPQAHSIPDSSETSQHAKSSTEGSTSNPEARSSTDGSSDMPATPADDKSFNLGQLTDAQKVSDKQGTVSAGPTVRPVVYKPDRFRLAVQNGVRRTLSSSHTSLLSRVSHPTEATISEAIVQPDGPYREGGITYGRGWCAHGLADPSLLVDRRRYVRIPNANAKPSADSHEGTRSEEERKAADFTEPSYQEVVYGDLGELIWTATTPDVIVRLVSHLDFADVKSLRQTSKAIRFALSQLGGREIVLTRFLASVGYRSWKPTKLSDEADAPMMENDPMPLTFCDCEDFLLSFDLLPDYRLVGAEYARAAHKMDPRYPRLARASTRAYNRVLTRLRMQPDFRLSAATSRQESMPVSPLVQQAPIIPSVDRDVRAISPAVATITSPWKPGRAGFFRAWVPSTEVGGWLSDVELARCERELFIAGVWPHLKKGDVVWDCAIGDERNEGKYIFDGRYLRDLSFMFDRIGHLPSWLNAFSFVPSYYHNIIQSADPSEPVVYLDVLPWRDQIVSTLRLVQDQVETLNPQGVRYRISKWLYRAVINISAGQAVSEEGEHSVDRGWHGRIVIETEGTAEHAKELVSRCAGPAESDRTRARLLASVMDSNSVSKGIPKAPAPAKDAQGRQIDTNSPWAIVRARSRPGLIWIRPLDARDRVVF